MSRWERTLEWIASKLRFRIITSDCPDQHGDYLRRYFIIGGPQHSVHGVGIYLHHIMRSDIDRHLHDHPWNFISILLTGSYTEVTPFDKTTYHAGQFVFRPAEWQHRLVLEKPMWTLVIRFNKKRSWGFITDRGWIHWKAYDYKQNCK